MPVPILLQQPRIPSIVLQRQLGGPERRHGIMPLIGDKYGRVEVSFFQLELSPIVRLGLDRPSLAEAKLVELVADEGRVAREGGEYVLRVRVS